MMTKIKNLKKLSVAEVACFLQNQRLSVFVDMAVDEEVSFFFSFFLSFFFSVYYV